MDAGYCSRSRGTETETRLVISEFNLGRYLRVGARDGRGQDTLHDGPIDSPESAARAAAVEEVRERES